MLSTFFGVMKNDWAKRLFAFSARHLNTQFFFSLFFARAHQCREKRKVENKQTRILNIAITYVYDNGVRSVFFSSGVDGWIHYCNSTKFKMNDHVYEVELKSHLWWQDSQGNWIWFFGKRVMLLNIGLPPNHWYIYIYIYVYKIYQREQYFHVNT